MSLKADAEVLVIGAGIVGIATAYYLCTRYRKSSVLLVDARPPMSYTSAQSGDNYRNWWPHPVMTSFTDDSIDLMERLAEESSNVFNMTRRGYLLATRTREIDAIVADLHSGYRNPEPAPLRMHTGTSAQTYSPPTSDDWRAAPGGVDVLSSRALIRRHFPSLSDEVMNVVHIRRAGDISSQQLGQFMLARIRDAGGNRATANVRSIEVDRRFRVEMEGAAGTTCISADVVVNAAGPFAPNLAAMLGVSLPIENVYQQKIAFDDRHGAIPRQLPFSIDMDDIDLGWTEEERSLLAHDTETAGLVGRLAGGAHCRPEGGDNGTWVKLGWACNGAASDPQQDLANEPMKNPQFPEIVMRAAARLHPALLRYVEDFPARYSHYGGYYSMTRENWPIIGPLGMDGAYVVAGLSGFGSMSACAAGALCATWISGGELPSYARQLSLARYDDGELMAQLAAARSRGVV